MRDRRFIAEHRGGPLSRAHHFLLAAWAADCAEHVLPLFAAHSQDQRPKEAIATARIWTQGTIRVGVAQKASIAAHAAARETSNPSAIAAARAAGHAVATAHFAEHSVGAALYALKAIAAQGGDVAAERAWQTAQLPRAIRELVVSALQSERMRHASPKILASLRVTRKPVQSSP
jgi:hypothetical protein